MSVKQQIGTALEQLAYDTLKRLLQLRLADNGTEKPTKNGILWISESYRLFWNKQVVKEGEYFKGIKGKRKRLADLVLCEIRLAPENWKPTFPDPTAVLAIELKNTNLNYQWTKAWMFDRDVISRFLWASDVNSILRMDNGGWERYAGNSNLFPQAIKVLIIPKFSYHPAASKEPAKKPDELQNMATEEYRKLGLIPLSNSEKGKIEWRIKRLKLRIYELGYQPKPNVPAPDDVSERLRDFLVPHLNELKVGPANETGNRY